MSPANRPNEYKVSSRCIAGVQPLVWAVPRALTAHICKASINPNNGELDSLSLD